MGTQQENVWCQEILRWLDIGGLCKCWNAVEVEAGYKYLLIWEALLLWIFISALDINICQFRRDCYFNAYKYL